MKRIGRSSPAQLLFLLLLLSVLGVFAQVTDLRSVASQEPRAIAPGVVYRHLLQKTPKGEPWSIHVLEVSRKEPGVSIRAVAARNPAPPPEMQRELPTQMAMSEIIRGHHVVAVINGDYDAYLGVSVGPSVTSGHLWTAGGKSTWPAFALEKDGEAVIGTPKFLGELRGGKQLVRIDTYNKSFALSRGVALYTREFRSSVKVEKPVRVVRLTSVSPALPLVLGSVVHATVGENSGTTAGEIPIGADELVVVAEDDSVGAHSLGRFKPAEAVQLKLQLRVGPALNPVEVIGGFPIVVRMGRREVIGNPSESHSKRHPRTAVCYNSKSVIFAVVDGRQPSLSVGMTLEELGDLMVSLGCTEAMNTDGGGSSVMAISDTGGMQLRIVNSPSDGRERGRGNAVIVESTSDATLH